MLLLALPVRLCVAEPEQPKAEQPRAFTDEEITAAEKTLGALPADQQLLINNLRYLLSPGYEPELMTGRRFRPCPLPPFETVPTEVMNALESVRLWAVLRSGMPVTPTMDKHVRRFTEMPLPTTTKSLAPYGLQLSICLAGHARGDTGHTDALKARAESLMKAAMAIRSPTDEKSEFIVGSTIQPKWYANHLWRAVTCRCALALEIKFNEDIWEKDIRSLCGACGKKRGWTSGSGDSPRADEDLNTNLLALAALSLAATAPAGAISDGVLRTIDKRMKEAPALLARLETDYPFQRLDGACLALTASFAPVLAPEGKQPAEWRATQLRNAALYEPTGAVKARRALVAQLELGEVSSSRYDRITAETALSCIGLSGGFVPADGAPLAKLGLPDIGRVMHALTVLHAHNLPRDSDGFESADPAAAEAIQAGCEYLESIQRSDGSFPGINQAYSGNTALALLAMMHGGWERSSGQIRKGLEWLLAYDHDRIKRGNEVAGVGYGNTYSDAIVLMFFQKYYEAEQRTHGIFWASEKADFEKARKDVWAGIDPKHQKLIDKMVKNIDESHVNTDKGGFGYYPNGNAAGGMAGVGATYSDNSCSQYAILGYKAASLLGAKVDSSKLKHEAKRLVRQYFPVEALEEVEFVRPEDLKKTSSKEWKGKIRPGGYGYGCGKSPPSLQLTAAGVSSLVVCQDELKLRGELEVELDREIELTIHGAQAWMATAYYTADEEEGAAGANGLSRWLNVAGMDGWSVFYNLYSVERACVLAGIENLGDKIDWYAIGADALIKSQQPEGSWGPEKVAVPQTVNICMAILFLKKASMPVITDPRRQVKDPPTPAPEPPKPKDPITGK